MNVLNYIGVSMLSHIMTFAKSRTDRFWDNFNYLVNIAIDAKIFTTQT